MYGMSSTSGYATQYSRHLERDVTRNKTSVGDYYARKAEMLKILMTDNDSGESCTRGKTVDNNYNNTGNICPTNAAPQVTINRCIFPNLKIMLNIYPYPIVENR